MSDTPNWQRCVDVIQQRVPNFKAEVGLVLGSGLGAVADSLDNATSLSYEDLPGFPVSSVSGHAGRLVLGTLQGKQVACLQGRAHLYEGHSPKLIQTQMGTLAKLGCRSVLITNASGSLREEVGPGELVLVNDHINCQGTNPLIGPNDEALGPRFVSMDVAYDVELRAGLQKTAQTLGIHLPEGVYVSVLGPMFETPAEIRAFKTLGADLVGMSTVPDVIAARHAGMRVAVVATITNFAAGMSDELLSHEGTLYHATRAAEKMTKLLSTFIESYDFSADNVGSTA